jgi:hypothetical protein
MAYLGHRLQSFAGSFMGTLHAAVAPSVLPMSPVAYATAAHVMNLY